MDSSDWISALRLYMTHPLLIVATVVLILFFVALAWYLRGHTAKERIAALEERLRLAGDEQKAVTREVGRLQTLVTQLPPELSTTPQVASTVTSLSTANNLLGATLTITGGRFRVMVDPVERITKRSS